MQSVLRASCPGRFPPPHTTTPRHTSARTPHTHTHTTLTLTPHFALTLRTTPRTPNARSAPAYTSTLGSICPRPKAAQSFFSISIDWKGKRMTEDKNSYTGCCLLWSECLCPPNSCAGIPTSKVAMALECGVFGR